ncbi:MAG: polyphosphate kinase 2 [Calditrichaeota bacterium]|nr:polyphosphate kinase 2 [Calditrichota bacterium]
MGQKKQINKNEVTQFRESDIKKLTNKKHLVTLLNADIINKEAVHKTFNYYQDLEQLQIELVKMQRWIQETKKRLAIIFEGRDTAGKGGAIRRFTEHLNPRAMRVVALPKPNEVESGQWYFQRYTQQLPNPGEIVFFDRSWYNRAVVEPVNGFCTKREYNRFMRQLPEYEHMLYESGIILVKFWFSISKEEQLKRFEERKTNPLKQWKLSSVDDRAQELWDDYTHYKEEMFSRTHTTFSPWIIVKANNKKRARLESIRYVLSILDYTDKAKSEISLYPDPNCVSRFHRSAKHLD